MYFLMLIICSFSIGFAERHICKVQACLCEEKKISCRNKDPQEFEIEINSKILYLDFRRCSISYFQKRYFNRFTALRTVDIREQTVDFDCKSLPEKSEYDIKSDCLPQPTLTLLPATSTLTSTLTSLKTSSKLFSTSSTSKRTPNFGSKMTFTPSLTQNTFSKVQFTSTHSWIGYPTTEKTTHQLKTSSKNTFTDFFSTLETSKITPELIYTTSKSPTSTLKTSTSYRTDETLISNLKTSTSSLVFSTLENEWSSVQDPENISTTEASALTRRINPWLFVSGTFIFLTCFIIIVIIVLILLRKRRIRLQMNNIRRGGNRIYLGDNQDFDAFAMQMSTQKEEEDEDNVSVSDI